MTRAPGLPLKEILSRVSRSFYLSLWLLPKPTRETVAVAYLLARAADTVADTRLASPTERVRLLSCLDDLFQGEGGEGRVRVLAELAGLSRSPDMIAEEKELLAELGTCLGLLEGLPELDRRHVRTVLRTITGGMQKDLERFPGEDSGALTALATGAELVDYTYRVAGCVGEFWSDLHADRLRELRNIERERWREQGVGLGRALQMTNVLRDVRRDLEHGRCYLPLEDLEARGLAASDLLDPQSWPRLKPVYEHWTRVALADAKEGLRHTLAIPPRLVSLRLAGLLPLLLAIPTLGLTLNGNPLDPGSRRKISRSTVYGTLARAYCAARQNRSLVRLFRETLRTAGLAGL